MSDFVARLAVKGMMTCAGCRDAENKQPHTCGIDFALHEQERTSVGAAAAGARPVSYTHLTLPTILLV